MKLRVFIITKSQIIWLFITLLLIIGAMVSIKLFSNNSYDNTDASIATMSQTDGEQAIKKDLNGDGKDDLLYIAAKNGKYYVEANIKNESYPFNCSKSLNTLGYHYNYWPISLNLIDLSRDKKPELIFQSSQDNVAVQHIFTWYNNEFQDIFCSTNNIIGILDSKNNKTPRFFSFSIKNGISDIQNYMIIGNELKNISSANYKIPALRNVETFIDIVESSYTPEDTPNIFTNEISSEDLSILWKLDKDNFSYIFEDGYFNDTKWDKNGNIQNLTWNLNFKKISRNSKTEASKLPIKLEITKSGDGYFINSIK
jgi:hypothetical protein